MIDPTFVRFRDVSNFVLLVPGVVVDDVILGFWWIDSITVVFCLLSWWLCTDSTMLNHQLPIFKAIYRGL